MTKLRDQSQTLFYRKKIILKVIGGYLFCLCILGSVKAPAKTEDLIQSVLTGKYHLAPYGFRHLNITQCKYLEGRKFYR